MGVGESQPGSRQAIDVRRLHRLRAVRRDVTVSEVVGHDQHDVRPVLRKGPDRTEKERSHDHRAAKRDAHHGMVPSLEITSRTIACGLWFTVRNMRPRYSPINPSITSCVPEKIRNADMSQPNP